MNEWAERKIAHGPSVLASKQAQGPDPSFRDPRPQLSFYGSCVNASGQYKFCFGGGQKKLRFLDTCTHTNHETSLPQMSTRHGSENFCETRRKHSPAEIALRINSGILAQPTNQIWMFGKASDRSG